MDTQWPRWEVFKQDSSRKPHQSVGTVHAGDPETALLEARNVFVRRPRAVNLWVCRADDVYAITQQQLERADEILPDSAESSTQTYLVFRKTNQRRSMTFVDHVGEVRAASPRHALATAIEIFQDDKPTWVWWLVPAASVHSSDGVDPAAWFEPALDKRYRQQSAYGFVGRTRRGKDH